MITLDLDIAYLCSRYQMSAVNIQKYEQQHLTIEQMIAAEAQRGNPAAAALLVKAAKDPEELEKLFQLINPVNRYLILSNMNPQDLMMVISFLEPEEMVLGLSIFNEDVLIKLMERMKPEALAKVVLSQMDADKFLKIIPEEFLDQFLASDEIEKDMLLKAMSEIDEEQLQKMMEQYTGESCYDSKEDILASLAVLPEDKFKNALFMFEPEGKQLIISNVLKEKPELFQEFSAEAMVFPFRSMKKEEVLKSLTVLKTKDMMPMIEDMPKEILSIIASQIDPKVFSKILCSEFSDIIAKCGFKV